MAILTVSSPFSDGDQVTSTKLNSLVTAAAFDTGAVDNATTTLTAGGAIQVGVINTVNINSNAVTTAKIADATDTATGVTDSKLRWSAARSVLGRSAATSGAPADIAASADDQVLRRSGGTVAFGTITPSSLTQWMTSETAKSATGTSVDFTSIPSWVKRITVLFTGVSVDSSTAGFPIIQIGDSGGLENTGYTGRLFDSYYSMSPEFTSGFNTYYSSAASVTSTMSATITLIGSNTWIYSMLAVSPDARLWYACGVKQLSSTLDRLSVKPHAGNFDAGTINIIYE